MSDDCQICAKHRGEGPLVGEVIWSDEQVLVTHVPVDATGTATLGYVFVETRRHVAFLDALTEIESAAVARAAWRAARGIRSELAPEFVFTAVVGLGIPHFHQHLIPRYRGTPADYQWMASTQWPEAPHGDRGEIAMLAARLRPYVEK